MNLIEQNKNKDIKVTIYIPTHPISNSSNLQEDKIRFKNAVQIVQNQIVSHTDETNHIIKALENLLDQHDFWLYQSLSLAIFANKDGLETIKLPIELTELTEVGSSYIVTPLVLAHSMQLSSLVLDVNLEEPRLFLADTSSMAQLEQYSFKSIKDLLDDDNQKNQQFHSPSGSRSSTPMYHGHGGAGEVAREESDLYLSYLADEVSVILNTLELPLIITGEKQRLMQFEPLLDYKNINETKIYGNHQRLNATEFYDVVRDVLLATNQKFIDQELEQLNESKKIATGWTEIIRALNKKAVAKLFLPIVRKTNDSVRDGNKDNYVLEADKADKDFEERISLVMEQGGEIQAVPYDPLSYMRPQAIVRF